MADSTEARQVLEALQQKWPGVKHLFGDAAYDHRQVMDSGALLDFMVELVRRLQG